MHPAYHVLTLSREVDECKPLPARFTALRHARPVCRSSARSVGSSRFSTFSQGHHLSSIRSEQGLVK
jgi:hypothetical protein